MGAKRGERMKFIVFSFVCILSLPVLGDQWLAGDLHVHSVHSGGDSYVRELSLHAQKIGLNFYAVTDHDNKMKGAPLAWSEIREQDVDGVSVLYGMEWTSGDKWTNSIGHLNIWSDRPFLYEKFWKSNLLRDLHLLEEARREAGVLLSVNHPRAVGFSWELDYPQHFDAMEIWNGPFSLSRSNLAYRDWKERLQNDEHVLAVGGSDIHKIKRDSHTRMGHPTTWVRGKSHSSSHVMQALSEGRVVLTADPYILPPDLSLYDAHSEQLLGQIGDQLYTHGLFYLRLKLPKNAYSGVAFKELLLYRNGKLLKKLKVDEKRIFAVKDRVEQREKVSYFLELRGENKGALWGDSDILAITNPIYINF